MTDSAFFAFSVLLFNSVLDASELSNESLLTMDSCCNILQGPTGWVMWAFFPQNEYQHDVGRFIISEQRFAAVSLLQLWRIREGEMKEAGLGRASLKLMIKLEEISLHSDSQKILITPLVIIKFDYYNYENNFS